MKITQAFIILGWFLACGVVTASDAMAADLRHNNRRQVATGSWGCGWRHTCCPSRFSCASLYGAYGPYGGGAYWAQYTYGGWQYTR
jgi:hypothetical protein